MSDVKRVIARDFLKKKADGEKIAVLTAYEYSFAKLIDASGVDALLVGDSLGMVFAGNDSTIPVTLDDMIYHTKAVVRGSKRAMVICDMPFMSYQPSSEMAVANCGRVVKETGCGAVKIEGAGRIVPFIQAVVESGIPVMGHIGLTPQSAAASGGYKVQGKTVSDAKKLLSEAKALETAGVFSLVLECIPAELGKMISQRLRIPTISIGAGPGCDGQVLVSHDILGLYGEISPRFIKKYADLSQTVSVAFKSFVDEVKEGIFPADENCYKLKDVSAEELEKAFNE